jgi:hypothetical protein
MECRSEVGERELGGRREEERKKNPLHFFREKLFRPGQSGATNEELLLPQSEHLDLA